MGVPRQVREQSDRIEKHFEQVEKNRNPEDGSGEEVEDPKSGKHQDDPRSTDTDPPDEGGEPEGKPQDPGTEEQGKQSEAEYWKQRFSVLEGKYRAEVPRLQQANRELQQELERLRQQGPGGGDPSDGRVDPSTYLTEEEQEEFGDLAPVVTKVARRIASDITKPLEDRFRQQEARAEMTREEAFWRDLRRLVPDWERVNETDGFKQWLGEIDPYSGKERQALLEDAHRNLDAERVARFFNDWKAQQNRPAAPRDPSHDVLPDNHGQGDTPADGQSEPVWTRAQIRKFYADKAAGRFDSDEGRKEAERLENSLMRAQRLGNIR